jgi:hypothetical protein
VKAKHRLFFFLSVRQVVEKLENGVSASVSSNTGDRGAEDTEGALCGV